MFGLTVEDALFHGFAIVATISALLVVFMANPIYSALFLALTMSILGALFFMLEAYFVSVAQITVYAGAVMVLFVMVVMLFDLKTDEEDILKFSPLTMTKVLVVGILCGFFVGTGWLAVSALRNNPGTTIAPQVSANDLNTKGQGLPAVPSSPALEDEDLTEAEAAALVDKAVTQEVAAPSALSISNDEFGSTVSLSRRLFTNYVFAFEAVSLLLLLAIVGAVALAKSKGGTHNVG